MAAKQLAELAESVASCDPRPARGGAFRRGLPARASGRDARAAVGCRGWCGVSAEWWTEGEVTSMVGDTTVESKRFDLHLLR